MKVYTLRVLVVLMSLITATGFIVSCTPQAGESQEKAPSFAETQKPKAVYGKIQKVSVGATIDLDMAHEGKEIFEVKCMACHKYDERYVGPALGKVLERRTPEYVMNMILDTETMIDNDDTAKCLMQEYLMRMPNQDVTEKDARNVLEHLRDHAATSK